MAEGVDYSSARPGGAALAAAGKLFAVRYLAADSRGLTAGEVADLRGNGLAVAVVFESSAQRALSGFAAGVADAQTAVAQLAACGLPSLPVYFATDWPVAPAQFGVVDQYLAGAASVIGAGRVGVYGGRAIVEHCMAVRSASWFWQTYAWSGGVVLPGIHLFQYRNGQSINGGSVDLCQSMQPNFGQLGMGFSGESGTPIIADKYLGDENMKIISGGTIALVGEYETTVYTQDTGAQGFSIDANSTAFGQAPALTPDQVATLINEAKARRAQLVADVAAAVAAKVPAAAPVTGGAVNIQPVLDALAAFKALEVSNQGQLVAAIQQLPADVRAKIIAAP